VPLAATCNWELPKSSRAFSTAVSLHGHTRYSKESLVFLPELAAKNQILHWALKHQEKRCRKVRADFANAYWTPPLTAEAAHKLELAQIEDELGLAGIVSLSDHDSIEAGLELCAAGRDVPISIEWTAPVGKIDVHLGIHNLPPKSAGALTAAMFDYTANEPEHRLGEILTALNEIPEVLIVLNHPLWDISRVGKPFNGLLNECLRHYNDFFHAYELNGLRSRAENDAVVKLAEAWNRPVISGGDRHGCEPNAIVNLTRARTMADFADEVRKDGRSHVLFMPRYRESLELRTLQQVIDVIQEYPFHPVGTSWDDRVFHPDASGTIRPLSTLWTHPPRFIETIFGILRGIEENALRWNRKLIRDRSQVSRELFLHPGEEVA